MVNKIFTKQISKSHFLSEITGTRIYHANGGGKCGKCRSDRIFPVN